MDLVHKHIGRGRCPVVDTWWQTETGMIMISPLPGITATKPGSATRPLPGIVAEVVDASGSPVGQGLAAIWFSSALARDDAHHLRRSRPLREAILVAVSRERISPATAARWMRTAISGCWAAWMM